MELFLFIVDGKPGFRLDLSDAQACLEDHLLDDRSISQVQWGDEGDERYGAYLWKTSLGFDERAPHSGQVIWPVTVPEQAVVADPAVRDTSPFLSGSAELTLTVRTDRGKTQVSQTLSAEMWSETGLRAYVMAGFATNAAAAISMHFADKEST